VRKVRSPDRDAWNRAGVTLAAALLAAAAWTASGAAGDGAELLLVPDRIKADTLVVLAHPDDEGVVAPLVARYALGESQRVVHLYLTAGEKGADRVGAVAGESLGLMRLTELHRTLDRLGVFMFHALGRPDVIRARGPEDVLSQWGREETVGDLVRFLRLTRPEQVLTWFPGPASEHDAHAAVGAAVLLACRAAADAAAYPEQMESENLRAYEVPEVWLFAQPEKVSYQPFPSVFGVSDEAGANVRDIPVAVPDERTGILYTDIAGQAMIEQRTIGAITFTSARGPWVEPLRLMRPWGGAAPGMLSLDEIGPARAGIDLPPSVLQAFLAATAREVDAPRLTGFFDPEVELDPSGDLTIAAAISNPGAGTLRGKAGLSLPEGWTTAEGEQSLALAPGERRTFSWTITARPASVPERSPAAVKVRLKGGGEDEIVSRFVLKILPRL